VQTEIRPGLYGDGGGLYLQVTPSAAKSWIFRYQIAGRRRDLGLGPVSLYGLAEARQRAYEARRMVADGIDPIEVKRQQLATASLQRTSASSFRDCAEAYISTHQTGWRNSKHAAQWSSTLKTYVYPVFGDLAVAAVNTGLVMKVIEPMWTAKTETASRVRGRIESVLDWASARGYRQGENPARWRGHLDNLLPARSKVRAVEHHAALPCGEIGAFIAELRQQDGIGARALEFVILTAARTGEALGARWHEFDLDRRVWIVPTARVKAGREHRVPLSGRAVAIVEEMAAIRQHEFVFAGARPGRPLSQMALLMTLRRMGRGDLTTHGFRSTFRDWTAESTVFPAEVAEMALGHAVADKVEAAYRRGDLFEKRRELLDAWGRFCDARASVPEKVVAFR
jgi:integrase